MILSLVHSSGALIYFHGYAWFAKISSNLPAPRRVMSSVGAQPRPPCAHSVLCALSVLTAAIAAFGESPSLSCPDPVHDHVRP